MKRLFIINPHAGGGYALTHQQEMDDYFTKKIGDFPFVLTESREDATLKATEAVQAGIEQIIAIGGDGSLNAVVNGLFENGKALNPNVQLVVTDLGTGCDYYRTVTAKHPKKDWKELVTDFTSVTVDVGLTEFESPLAESRYFINMATIAAGAEVAAGKESMPPWLPTTLQYLIPSVQQMIAYKPKDAKIFVDHEEFNFPLMVAFCGKGTFAGGGMKLGGDNEINDGHFTITLVEDRPYHELITEFAKVYMGNLSNKGGVRRLKGKRLRIECPQSLIRLETDGEVYGYTPMTLSVVPKALKVCFPK
jgi:YegS/Rv2252/BmrU family lipid kinase